jgi:hypothetical protein
VLMADFKVLSQHYTGETVRINQILSQDNPFLGRDSNPVPPPPPPEYESGILTTPLRYLVQRLILQASDTFKKIVMKFHYLLSLLGFSLSSTTGI